MTTDEKFTPPNSDEYGEYYHRYVGLVPAGDFATTFQSQIAMLENLLGDLPGAADLALHEPYTWTLRQVVGHLIDCERIFSTRLLRIGAGDQAAQPGMDQDVYVANLDYTLVTMRELLDEFSNLRRSNVLLAKRMSAESLARVGAASGLTVSAKANLFILAGHVEYHANIVRKRLGK